MDVYMYTLDSSISIPEVFRDSEDGLCRVVGEALRACVGSEPDLGVRLEQPPVQIICDLPSILHLSNL